MTQATVIGIDQLPGAGHAERFEGSQHSAQVSFFVNHNPPGTGTGLHSHPYEETFIVQAGRVRFTVSETTIDASAGDIVIVPAHTPHKFLNPGDTTLRKISIHPVPEMQTRWLQDPEDTADAPRG